MEWEIVIGLEVHAQLSTKTKIFSGASTAFGSEPNTQADAVSLALPGVLPVLNKGAVARAIKFGLATDAQIAPRSVFARKNYFYPDLPKGYQISQFDLPTIGQGELDIQVETAPGKSYQKTVRLTRAHLEEDAGKSLHEDFHGMTGIDLNRAGTPLLEIVSEPDMRSAAEAVAYAKALHALVRWIGICDGNMQEGSFRCDANVSVRRPGGELGTRREIKNLNSFRFLQQAIEYEAQWQMETLEDGGTIQQATVLFDPDKGETRVMRTKEDAHDYRYFPDPDLLPVEITPQWIEQIRQQLPELPQTLRQRYTEQYGLPAYDASVLTASREMADYFDGCVAEVGADNAKLCANWLMGEVAARLNREGLDITQSPVAAVQLAAILQRVLDDTISAKGAKTVLAELWQDNRLQVDQVIASKGLKQVTDSAAIEKLVDEILAANEDKVAEYRSGKEKLFGFFVGQAMRASKGQANPAQLNQILKQKLSS